MSSNNAKLSRSILEMKFMKRTKEKVEKAQFQEEGEEYFGSEFTKRMKTESEKFINEPSYTFCEKLIDGRVSFRGMNPEIEKLMEAEQHNERIEKEVKRETDISDEQMVKHWKNQRNIIKTNYKYEKPLEEHDDNYRASSKRPKFLKPEI